MIVCVRVARLDSPEVGEPLDELSGVVFVELDVGEEEFDDGTAWVAHVEEHKLGFAQVHDLPVFLETLKLLHMQGPMWSTRVASEKRTAERTRSSATT